MTGMQEIAFLDWAKTAGADSFIYKESSEEDFAACIRETMSGTQIYPDVFGSPSFGIMDAKLTERELEILQLVCHNRSYEEIAHALGIKKRTVSFHVSNMLEKTGYRSLIGLAVEAAEKGYASIEMQAEEF